jgi:CBS domain-containing protein
MDREVPRVDARLTLEEVREKLAEQGARVAAVFSGETYLGLISREDIAEAFAVLRYVEAAGRPQTGEVMT